MIHHICNYLYKCTQVARLTIFHTKRVHVLLILPSQSRKVLVVAAGYAVPLDLEAPVAHQCMAIGYWDLSWDLCYLGGLIPKGQLHREDARGRKHRSLRPLHTR